MICSVLGSRIALQYCTKPLMLASCCALEAGCCLCLTVTPLRCAHGSFITAPGSLHVQATSDASLAARLTWQRRLRMALDAAKGWLHVDMVYSVCF